MNDGTVIYIGSFEFPDKNAATQRVISNAKAIRELGYNVVFIGINNDNEFEKKKYFGFDVYSRKYPENVIDWFKFITTYQFYLNIIRKYSHVKAIICYNSPSISLFLLHKWGRKHNVKIIADCTEWYEVSKSEKFIHRFVKKIDIYCRMNLIHPKLHSVIAISRYLKDFYEIKGTKTVQIPPLSDTNDVKWHKNSTTVSEYKNIVYVGIPFSLTKMIQKDRIDVLIKALLSYEQKYKFVFHVIGCTKKDFLTFYPRFVDLLKGKDDIIKFYGKLPHSVAINKIKECDYCIFVRDNTLTNRAGFPTKFTEGISCGIPILTNKNSNVDDYLLEGVNGFFINNETEEKLKKSLKKPLSLNNDELLKMKIQVYNSKLFDYRKYINEFKKILQ